MTLPLWQIVCVCMHACMSVCVCFNFFNFIFSFFFRTKIQTFVPPWHHLTGMKWIRICWARPPSTQLAPSGGWRLDEFCSLLSVDFLLPIYACHQKDFCSQNDVVNHTHVPTVWWTCELLVRSVMGHFPTVIMSSFFFFSFFCLSFCGVIKVPSDIGNTLASGHTRAKRLWSSCARSKSHHITCTVMR